MRCFIPKWSPPPLWCGEGRCICWIIPRPSTRLPCNWAGRDPAELAQAARMGAEAGYDEINLNVGCPSDRVQSGTFGAVLMKAPGLVAECCAAMTRAVDVEVTVKCRIGVDDQNPEEVLPEFLSRVGAAGVSRFTIHARKPGCRGFRLRKTGTYRRLTMIWCIA